MSASFEMRSAILAIQIWKSRGSCEFIKKESFKANSSELLAL